MRLRPASFVTLPPGLAWEFVEMPPDIAHQRPDLPRSVHRFGVIATVRPLTDEELERYDIDVDSNEPLSTTASAPPIPAAGAQTSKANTARAHAARPATGFGRSRS